MSMMSYSTSNYFHYAKSLPIRSKLSPSPYIYDNQLYIIEDILFEADDIQLTSKYIEFDQKLENMNDVLNSGTKFKCNLSNPNYRKLDFSPAVLILNHKGIIESLSINTYLEDQKANH